MDPRALCGQVDSILQSFKRAFAEKMVAEKALDKSLYEEHSKANHGLGILNLLFSKAHVRLERFQSVKELESYFSDMRRATAALKGKTSSSTKQKSPVQLYCEKHHIDVTALQKNSINVFCKIIRVVGLLMRQKYLLSQFADDDTADNLGNCITGINKKFKEALARLSEHSSDELVKKSDEINLVFNRFCQNLKAKGYLFDDWPMQATDILATRNKFGEAIGKWIACLPKEITGEASSLVEQKHRKATLARSAGKNDKLFEYRLKASAHAYRLNTILPHLQNEMEEYLSGVETLLAKQASTDSKKSFLDGDQQKVVDRITRLIRVFEAINVGFKRQSVKSARYRYKNLKIAFIAISQLVKLKKEELNSLSQFRTNLRKFTATFLTHSDSIELFISQTKSFNNRKEELVRSKKTITEQFELAQINLDSAWEQLSSTAGQYTAISNIKPRITFGQLIKDNWKIALIGVLLFAGAFSAVGFFYLALPLIPIIYLAAGGGLGGSLIGFALGVFIDHQSQTKLPDAALLSDEYFPDPLPSAQAKDSYATFFSAGLKPVAETRPMRAEVIDVPEDELCLSPDEIEIDLTEDQEPAPIRSFQTKK